MLKTAGKIERNVEILYDKYTRKPFTTVMIDSVTDYCYDPISKSIYDTNSGLFIDPVSGFAYHLGDGEPYLFDSESGMKPEDMVKRGIKVNVTPIDFEVPTLEESFFRDNKIFALEETDTEIDLDEWEKYQRQKASSIKMSSDKLPPYTQENQTSGLINIDLSKSNRLHKVSHGVSSGAGVASRSGDTKAEYINNAYGDFMGLNDEKELDSEEEEELERRRKDIEEINFEVELEEFGDGKIPDHLLEQARAEGMRKFDDLESQLRKREKASNRWADFYKYLNYTKFIIIAILAGIVLYNETREEEGNNWILIPTVVIGGLETLATVFKLDTRSLRHMQANLKIGEILDGMSVAKYTLKKPIDILHYANMVNKQFRTIKRDIFREDVARDN